MIEIEARQQILPTAGGVASLTGFLELAFVRIDVTGRAGVELHVLIAHRSPGDLRFMTFFADYVVVQAR